MRSLSNVIIIITDPPYGTENAYGFLAAAGVLATIHNTTVIFSEAGVLNTLKNQNTSDFIEFNKKYLNIPSHESKIKDFREIPIQFFVQKEALDKRGITDEDIIEDIEKLTIDQITEKILENDQVLII